MQIKRYDEFDNVNESVSGAAIIINILRALLIFVAYTKTLYAGTKNIDLNQEISEISGVNCPDIIEISPKKQEKTPVACATPNKIFYDKQLKKILTHRELVAVILHELSHIKNRDSVTKQVLLAFPFIPIAMLDSWFLFFLLPFVNKILIERPYSRRQEYGADSFASKFGYGEELLSALVKITQHYSSKQPKREVKPEIKNSLLFKLIKKLFDLLATHPSLIDRIKKVRFYSEESPEDFIKRIERDINNNKMPDGYSGSFSEEMNKLREEMRKLREMSKPN